MLGDDEDLSKTWVQERVVRDVSFSTTVNSLRRSWRSFRADIRRAGFGPGSLFTSGRRHEQPRGTCPTAALRTAASESSHRHRQGFPRMKPSERCKLPVRDSDGCWLRGSPRTGDLIPCGLPRTKLHYGAAGPRSSRTGVSGSGRLGAKGQSCRRASRRR
jgi:hypothetical protein